MAYFLPLRCCILTSLAMTMSFTRSAAAFMVVGVTVTLAASPTTTPSVTESDGQVAQAPGVSLMRSQSDLVATATSLPEESAPPFDRVDLERTLGRTTSACGTFDSPSLSDNGTTRSWTYRMAQPKGQCSPGAGVSFAAVGMKGSQRTPSPSVP